MWSNSYTYYSSVHNAFDLLHSTRHLFRWFLLPLDSVAAYAARFSPFQMIESYMVNVEVHLMLARG